MSKKYVSGKHAYGFCDRTGFRYPIADLIQEFVQGVPTGLRVGRDVWDSDHPQNWLGKIDIKEDAQAIKDARPDNGLDESRRLSSFAPVGLGNTSMYGRSGSVTAS